MRTPRVFAADILRILDALPESEHLAALRAAGYALKTDGENLKAKTPDEADPALLLEPPPDRLRPPPPLDLADGFGPIFWRIAEDLPTSAAPRQRQPPEWLSREPARFDKARFVSAPRQGAPLPVVPLVSADHFARFVADYLRPHQAGLAPDLPRAVDRLARGRNLQPLPRLSRRKWPGSVQVVLDWSGVLTPFRADLLALLGQLRRLLDRRIEVLVSERGEPDDWLQAPGFASRLRFDGSPVVVLGDGGAYRPSTALYRRWASLAKRFGAVGVRPLLLAPVPARRLPDALREAFDVVLLGQGASLRLVGGEPTHRPDDVAEARFKNGLAQLRAALFGNSHVSWRLVRQLRLALQDVASGDFAVDVGTEAELWQDAEVCAVPTGCALAMDAVEPALARLRALQAAHPAVLTRLVAHHLDELAQGSPLLDAIFVSEAARSGLAADDPAVQARQPAAQALVVELARCLHGEPKGAAARELAAVLGEFIGGLSLRSPGAVGRGDEPLQTAWALARSDAIRGGEAGLPEGLDLARLDWLIGAERPLTAPLHLVATTMPARGGSGARQLQLALVKASSASAVPSALLRNLEDELPVSVAPLDSSAPDSRRVLVPGQPRHLPGGQAYRIETRRRKVVIEPFERPGWARSVRFVDIGFEARSLEGRQLVWVPRQQMTVLAHEAMPIEGNVKALSAPVSGAFLLPQSGWWDRDGPESWDRFFVTPPKWAVRHGTDEFGFWAEFDVKGRSSTVTQRCRWIAPVTFQMGSPVGEVDRSNNETQHEVTLTRGYWLADTACTQALWQAVMGDNPSEFKDDPANPVEQVSWDYVQIFIDRINARVPGLAAGLPSEAQWENACRAGTATPFSFGDNITPAQVNYNGEFPYADGKKGQVRVRTVPVQSLPPNLWGLYEMHGNVWEWCADWYGDYPEGPQIDPSGPPEGVFRVLRGGSWYYNGQLCRAAYRYRFEPGYLFYGLGFRLAPGQRPGPAGQEAARRVEGASAMRSVAEQAPAERAGPAAGSDAGGKVVKPRSKKGSKKP